MSDRLIQQGEGLFGVRFGKQTRYCLLDIDITSVYHPCRDAFAVSNLAAALEPLGLVDYVACTSSHSRGIHLFFPFQQAQNSWEVAAAVATMLERAGFVLAPGQLELFPNPRPYVAGAHPSLFHAHRLPMQAGSYLLNKDCQPIWSDRSTFVQRWRFAQHRNDLDSRRLKQLVQVRQKLRHVSGKAEKFMSDLEAEIAAGWTGPGQTNRLLGRIALRTYVFHHILFGGEPLVGPALVNQIVATARSLPGYQEWCQHQHEIDTRAAEWARCVEGSRYFPYGSRRSIAGEAEDDGCEDSASIAVGTSLNWNQQQSESARERIRQAIVQLLEIDRLPAATTARFQALTQSGIGGSSLYRHKDLWHPAYLVEPVESVENPPDPPTLNIQQSDSAEGASDSLNSTSLFPSIDRNSLQHQVFARSISPTPPSGCNSLFPFLLLPSFCPLPSSPDQRMHQFLNSGDAILVAEALSYFQHRCTDKQHSDTWLESENSQSFIRSEAGVCSSGVCSRSHPARLEEGEELALALEAPEDLPGDLPEDLSNLLATITIEIRRLGWTKEQTVRHLRQQFGKSHQSRLNKGELVNWLGWLKAYRFPADTG